MKFSAPVTIFNNEALQKLEWWNWDHARTIRNRALFEGSLTLEKIKEAVS